MVGKSDVSDCKLRGDHFTVLCSVTRPLNKSEAGVDLALIQTSLLFLCKSFCCNANEFYLHKKSSEVCIKTRSNKAALLFKGLVTEHRTVKWSIVLCSQPAFFSALRKGIVPWIP